jgi:regulator of sirC expression with transglutaminase-like and TPR domain
MELARRLGINVVGVGLPGHFVVRHEPDNGKPQLIDVYDAGAFLSKKDAIKIVAKFGKSLKEEHLAETGKKAILVRMLHNLLSLAQAETDANGMLRYVDAILTITPDSPPERWIRAVLRYEAGQHEGALVDVDWLLDNNPGEVPLERVRELRRLLQK